MNTVAFIFARSGSKGLPGKNIRMFSGKPLIAWSIEHAKAVKKITRVIVSTDSCEIAEIAKAYGAEVPFLRPSELASDSSSEWLAWRHALDFLRNSEGALPDVMVSVPATSPLRIPTDIERAIDLFSSGGCDGVIAITPSHRSPWFNMVTIEPNGKVKLIIQDSKKINRRQDSPSAFDVTTVVYVMDPNFVLQKEGLFDGRIGAIEVPHERAVDIDTLYDFQLAEWAHKYNFLQQT